MRRIEDIGAEARAALGRPGPGPDDAAFVAALSRRTRRSAWRRIALIYTLTAAAAAALLATLTPSPTPTESEAVEDPMAAILLESAELRLEGFGDAAEAPVRLREVVKLYPGTRSAARAGALLREIERSPR